MVMDGGAQAAEIGCMEFAQQNMVIVNPPDPAPMWFQIYIAPREGFPDKALAPLRFDFTGVTDPAFWQMSGIT